MAAPKQSAEKEQAKGKMFRSIEEEEKVPNEHPQKRRSIGLGYYQTNYFSQTIQEQENKADCDISNVVDTPSRAEFTQPAFQVEEIIQS